MVSLESFLYMLCIYECEPVHLLLLCGRVVIRDAKKPRWNLVCDGNIFVEGYFPTMCEYFCC